MSLNVSLSLAEQLREGDSYTFYEKDGAEKSEKGENEKETEKEKEVKSTTAIPAILINAYSPENDSRTLFASHRIPGSAIYATLPEQPPKC